MEVEMTKATDLPGIVYQDHSAAKKSRMIELQKKSNRWGMIQRKLA